MVAGHLQEKKGYFYMVLTYKDHEGKRKSKWITTGLTVKGNKKRAQDLLQEAILKNLDTKEFFVDKAIGWVLREYVKTHEEFVLAFLKTEGLSSLSRREGGKHLSDKILW